MIGPKAKTLFTEWVARNGIAQIYDAVREVWILQVSDQILGAELLERNFSLKRTDTKIKHHSLI